MNLARLSLTPFLSDALSVSAFYFLVTKSHGSLAIQICDRMDAVLPNGLAGRRAEFEVFLADAVQAVDMHRRMNLAALVAIGGMVAIHEAGFRLMSGAVVAWTLFYYITTQIAPPIADLSRHKLKSSRRKMTLLFFLWVFASVAFKLIALVGRPHT